MCHAELLADFTQIARRAALVLHHARAADHFKLRDLCEVGQDLVLDALGEEGVRFFFAQIFERKDRDAFFHGSGERTSRSFAQKRENQSGERGHHQQPDRHCRPTHMGAMALNRLELLGQLRITDFAVVKVGKADAHPMFHFAFAQVMEIGAPARILFEIICHMLGKKNVSGVAAIHHPLSRC